MAKIKKFNTYKESGLKNPKKADLNKDTKISTYEYKRGKAIEDNIKNKFFNSKKKAIKESAEVSDSIKRKYNTLGDIFESKSEIKCFNEGIETTIEELKKDFPGHKDFQLNYDGSQKINEYVFFTWVDDFCVIFTESEGVEPICITTIKDSKFCLGFNNSLIMSSNKTIFCFNVVDSTFITDNY